MKALRALTFALGLYVAARTAADAAGWWPAAHHVLETAWWVFVVVAGVVAYGGRRARVTPSTPEETRFSLVALAFVCASLLLFGRTLFLGGLSDDFVLMSTSSSTISGLHGQAFFRPAVMLAFRFSDAWFHASFLPLHLLGVVLHGLNAALVSRCAFRLGLRPPFWTFAGALFLTTPLAVEAVAWPSALADVIMTTGALVGLLAYLETGRYPGLVLIGATALAISAKETGVVVPMMALGVAPLAPRLVRRNLLIVACMLGLCCGLYALWHYYAIPVSSDIHFGLSRYRAKEFVGRVFGSLAAPFSQTFLTRHPVLATSWPVGLACFIAFSASRVSLCRQLRYTLAVGAGVALVGALPIYSMLYVSGSLQGSRYLYLPMAGFSLMGGAALAALEGSVTTSASEWRRWSLSLLVLGALVASTWSQLDDWVGAAAMRDDILLQFSRVSNGCTVITRASGIPDSNGGAFLFRNGFAEAVAREQKPAAGGSVPCAVDYNNGLLRVSK